MNLVSNIGSITSLIGPARYLIDANGTVRHIKFGEGDYDVTEKLIRELLTDANPSVNLPTPTESADIPPQDIRTPETYLSVGKVVNYGDTEKYDEGTAMFTYPPTQPADTFTLNGLWTLDYQGATAGTAIFVGLSKGQKGFLQISVVKAGLCNRRQFVPPCFRNAYPRHAE